MNNNINLLGKSSKNPSSVHTSIRIFRAIALVMLFLIPALSVILYFLISLSPLPALRQQEAESQATLEGDQQYISQLTIIRDKTNIISQTLSQRPTYDAVLTAFEDDLTPGMSVTVYTLNGQLLSLTVSATSFSSVAQFFQNLTNKSESTNLFNQVQLDSLTQDSQTNDIDVSVHMSLL